MIITLNYIYTLIVGLILTGIAWWFDSKLFADKSSSIFFKILHYVLLIINIVLAVGYSILHDYSLWFSAAVLIVVLITSSSIYKAPSQLKKAQGQLFLLIILLIIWLCMQNFPATLTLLVAGTGFISLIDLIFFQRKRKMEQRRMPLVAEYARSFFLVLFLVWVIRSFIIQPYRVPTGSLEPTVMPGDFLAVNQFAYGLRFPISNYTFLNIGKPKRGDIALFYWPPNPSVIYVKRVIGLPGDHVVYKDKVLYINGKEMTQSVLGSGTDIEPVMGTQSAKQILNQLISEDLAGVKHNIFVKPSGGLVGNVDVVVPPGMYFMMGDNRDDGIDSRGWGFVPEHNLIGKAFLIWMSWDPIKHRVVWHRIGTVI